MFDGISKHLRFAFTILLGVLLGADDDGFGAITFVDAESGIFSCVAKIMQIICSAKFLAENGQDCVSLLQCYSSKNNGGKLKICSIFIYINIYINIEVFRGSSSSNF